MSMKRSRWRTPSDEAIAEAAEALDWLNGNAFATGAIAQVRDAYRDEAGRRHLALKFVLAHAERAIAGVPVAPEAVATLLVLLSGREAAIEAVSHVVEAPGDDAGRAAALELANVLDLDLRPPEATARDVEALAAEMAGIMGPQSACAACVTLLRTPSFLRQALAEAMIARGKPRTRFARTAALAMFFPFEAGIKRRFREWLASEGGADGAWLLARLADGPLPAVPPKPGFANALPLDWPVVEAFASAPDGSGSQGLLLARKRPNGRIALFSAVVSDVRGVASGMSEPELIKREYQQLLGLMQAGVGTLVPVPAGYVLDRLDAALSRSHGLGLPVPLDVQASRYLLWGLPRAPHARAHEQRWHSERRLDDTGKLLATTLGASWIFAETQATREFFAQSGTALLAGRTPIVWLQGRKGPGYSAEAMIALDALVGRWLCAFFDDPTRRLWHDRLLETAVLADLAHDMETRTLVATAAWAIAPESGVPLSEQPFAREMLAASAFAWLEREEEAEAPALVWLDELLRRR